MKTYELTYAGHTQEIEPVAFTYANNNTLAIQLYADNMPYATLTTNIEESNDLPNDYAFVDINNCDFAEEFINENGLGEFVGYYGQSGFCTYPLYLFYVDKLNKGEEK